jgi:hypothetical protein
LRNTTISPGQPLVRSWSNRHSWPDQIGGPDNWRRSGGGAISMNSNNPGDTLVSADVIAPTFCRTLGQMFEPRTTIEIFRCVRFCR